MSTGKQMDTLVSGVQFFALMTNGLLLRPLKTFAILGLSQFFCIFEWKIKTKSCENIYEHKK